jgi:uncharacterized metal-binding protein
MLSERRASMDAKTECAKCTKVVCNSEQFDQGPSNCPTQTKTGAIERALAKYSEPEVREFARMASVQEFEGYMNLPSGRTPINPRVEEVVGFAKKMGYKKLGIAFCIGLKNEAQILTTILENRGFEVVSVCCKAGAVPKETIGVEEEQKVAGAGVRESMCNPIAQAEILNEENTDFNIVVGLCVGHDFLFFKHAHAPTTVLIAKDRVFGHNPAAALYLSSSYYRKLLRKET